MATTIIMPKMGMAMTEGTVTRWTKRPGDPVRAGETVAVVETDKVQADLSAPADGRLGEIRVPEGERAPVGAVLAVLLPAGEDLAQPEAPASVDGAARLTPAARRVARELGLDPAAVAAAFPGGRVTREDIEAWAARRRELPAPPASAPAPAPAPAPEPSAPAPPATRGGEGVTVTPFTAMRATIARRMVQSLQEAAQLTLTAEVDVTELVRLRGQIADACETAHGIRPTYTDFLVRAIALAVPAVPEINARWTPEGIAVSAAVHVGVAVALEAGLIVPVVRDAQALGLLEISRRIRDLGERARAGRLLPGETSGGTITLTNLGAEGIDAFTPILNPPEAAILGAGRIRTLTSWCEAGAVPRQAMVLSLTIDHRIVDGVPGARFLRRVAELLGNPALLLL